MKLNWGNWIAVVYSVFVLFILGMVYLTFGEKWDLVAENYYEQELQYQDKIDSKANAIEAGTKPKLSIKNQALRIKFPDSIAKAVKNNGKVEFFRPSDAAKDVSVKFSELNNQEGMNVPLSILSKGKYLAKISWELDGKQFYFEQHIIIP